MVPVVETARLKLRGARVDDLAHQERMLAEPEVMRFLGGAPLSREESWRKLLSSTGLWDLIGYGYWIVERKEDGRMIGIAGFADFKRDLRPSIEGVPEMGWIFASEAHGHGYASEAVAAGLAWIDETMPEADVVAIIDPRNAASIKVAKRAGFIGPEDALYRDNPILLFRRPAASPAAASTAAAAAP